MRRRVLVVDDDRQMVTTLCDILTLGGWEAEPAHSAEEAIEAVRLRPYAAVLMDVRMPGLNGVEAFRIMRVEQPALRVILMTAYTASDLLSEAEREGVLRVLHKPVALDGLLSLLEDAFDDSRPVLIVDDDRDYLRTLSGLLEERGYRSLEASSLEEAISRMEEKSPICVVLDLRLDHIEPRDSVLAIKKASPAVVLILYSGYPNVLDRTAADLPEGWVYACLRKPFPPERLLEVLDDVFAK